MGMDVHSESGIVFPVEDIVPTIFNKFNKEQIEKAINSLAKNYKDDWPTSKENLEKIKQAKELTDWFLDGFNVDDENIESYYLEQIWNIIIKATKTKLPDASFHYWTSGRLSDWNVPLETPCIVFNDQGLFVTKMSAKGKKLAQALEVKEIESATWTTLSY
jgi:hypothetical protein